MSKSMSYSNTVSVEDYKHFDVNTGRKEEAGDGVRRDQIERQVLRQEAPIFSSN